MRATGVMILAALLAASCATTKRAEPPGRADISRTWFGYTGIEICYLDLHSDGTGHLVTMLPFDSEGDVLAVTNWSVDAGAFQARCAGVTYPRETIALSGWALPDRRLSLHFDGRDGASRWTRDGSFRGADEVTNSVERAERLLREAGQ